MNGSPAGTGVPDVLACVRHGWHEAGSPEASCYGVRLARHKGRRHSERSGEAILAGRVFWDSNLDLVMVTEVAADVMGTDGVGQGEVAWHEVVRLRDGYRSIADSSRLGRHNPVSRLDAWSEDAVRHELEKGGTRS